MEYEYGFSSDTWEKIKADIRSILIETAKKNIFVTYSALVKRLEIEGLEPESYALASILGEISTEENELQHGMLSAVVVHVDDRIPGKGFFDLAKSLGRNIVDKDQFWLKELSDVRKYWSEHTE